MNCEFSLSHLGIAVTALTAIKRKNKRTETIANNNIDKIKIVTIIGVGGKQMAHLKWNVFAPMIECAHNHMSMEPHFPWCYANLNRADND